MTDRWSAIERIFHAALERPEADRVAYLAEVCAGDNDLRREVQALLDETSSASFLEQPALQVAAGLVTDPGVAPLIGHQLGVYRARDTRLGRDVAIKVLPPALTGHPDRLARFEREARVLASLNHPHIGMLHGVEESNGQRALVLELVEGETLAERLMRGRVPLKQALDWARQIADALDAAHEKGIVHRDLKPANIKITPQDVVKVLDFGLARTSDAFADASGETLGPTITLEGAAIVGTAAYMSPEQARGQTVDKRADVWAFGCVLYELLTGQMPFAGATVPDTLSAVLTQEPDWSALPSTVPPSVVTLLRRCLDKEVRRRRRDIGDIRAELEDTRADGPAQPAPALSPRPRRRRLLLWVAGAAALLAAVGIGRWADAWSRPAPLDASFRQFTDFVGIEEMPAASPDGKDVAFVFPIDGRRQIWLRRLGGGPAHQITSDAVDHDNPRWTPNADRIVYFTPAEREGESGTLWEIPALGGIDARKLTQAITGADVSHDGLHLATFQKGANGVSLVILDSDGAPVKTLAAPAALEYFAPRWSPDGRAIAFVANGGNLRQFIYTVDTKGGTPHVIAEGIYLRGFAWLPDSSGVVYSSAAGSTMRYPPGFNLRTVSRDGNNDRQLTIGDVSYVDPDIVEPGRIFVSRVRMASDLWRFPIAGSAAENLGKATRLTHQTAQVQTPSPSPDGKQIAYLSNSGGVGNIWVANIDGTGTARPLTAETDPNVFIGLPLWSPRGDWIVYIKSRGGQNTQWLIRSDGSDHHQLSDSGTGASWSPDGQWVYFSVYTPGTPSCIFKIRVEGGDRTRVRCNATMPSLTRDGTLYYSPGRPSLASEIFKASPPDAAEGTHVQSYSPSRIPWYPSGNILSPDERWIATMLKDGATTNIWAMPTDGGPMRQITDFRRAIMIARSVSWSSDSQSIYAAVGELDADIMLLEGITPPR